LLIYYEKFQKYTDGYPNQNPKVLANMENAIMGINQQKKAIMKQRLTSSVSIFFTSPYLMIKTAPRAAIPTTTIDQPTINHLKKSDKVVVAPIQR